MMKRKAVMVLSLLLMSVPACADCNGKWAFHSQLLQESFDTSRWRDFYPDHEWYVRCIFVDLDGDGRNELMTASPSEEEDRTGSVWKIWKKGGSKTFSQVFFSGEIHFLCHSDSFYKVSYTDKPDAVVGLGMNAGIEEDCGNGDRREVRPTPDCMFTLMPENKFMLHEIQPDVDTFFQRDVVAGIERLYPEWYFGFDFKPAKDVPYSPFTRRPPYRMPKGDLRRGGGMIESDDFATFVAEYRRKVKMDVGEKNKVAVYAVHLDADNDGDADCYVSSEAERTDDGKFKWSLYLRQGKTLSASLDAVFPVNDHKELYKLKPQVKASKDSFCRVMRFDVDPVFLILDDKSERSVIRDTIMEYETHRVEKLLCVEYPEK